MIGPALAGILAATFGPEWALIAEAGLALGALVLLMPLPDVDAWREEPDKRRVVHVVAEGLRTLVGIAKLRAVVGACAIGYGMLTVAFPLFAVDHLGAERTDAGFLWAAFAVGSTIGAVSLVRLQRIFAPWWIVIAGLPVFGALVLLWQLAGWPTARCWRRSSAPTSGWSRSTCAARCSRPRRVSRWARSRSARRSPGRW